MARVYERYGSAITAQASAAITADTMSGGATTAIDKASAGNADGAVWFDCYINVTAAPSAAAFCQLWIEGSPDGTNYAASEYALMVAVPATIDRYHIGPLFTTPLEFIATIKAISYGFTATLEIVPVYPADA